MRNVLAAAALAVAGLATTAATASAMNFGTTAPVASSLVQEAAYGCGPGWHPNPWGRCVPNARVYYGRPVYYGHSVYYRHPGWHHPYWHRY